MIILILFILLIGVAIGLNLSSSEIKNLLNEVDFYKSQTKNEIQRNARIDSIIRNTRNDLLYKQTELRNTPKEKQQNKALDYIGVNANVKLITKLEEAIRNEM